MYLHSFSISTSLSDQHPGTEDTICYHYTKGAGTLSHQLHNSMLSPMSKERVLFSVPFLLIICISLPSTNPGNNALLGPTLLPNTHTARPPKLWNFQLCTCIIYINFTYSNSINSIYTTNRNNQNWLTSKTITNQNTKQAKNKQKTEVQLPVATKTRLVRQVLVKKARGFIQEPQDLGEWRASVSKAKSLFLLRPTVLLGIGTWGLFLSIQLSC